MRLLPALALIVLLALLISGIMPYQATVYGQTCDWSFEANEQVCQPKAYTWMRNGWLVQMVTGCSALGYSTDNCLRR